MDEGREWKKAAESNPVEHVAILLTHGVSYSPHAQYISQ